jgi:hypothetical protein
MNDSLAQRRCRSFIAVLVCALQPAAPAEPIPVRDVEGTGHGFHALRSKEGRALAVPDSLDSEEHPAGTTGDKSIHGCGDAQAAAHEVAISPHGEEPFSLLGSRRKGMHFTLKVELGGVAGVVAPLIGREPPKIQVWIIGRDSSSFRERRRATLSGRPRLDDPTDQPRLAGFTALRFLELHLLSDFRVLGIPL